MAKQSNGRHRLDVEINVFEEMELRSRRSIREAERKRSTRRARVSRTRAAATVRTVETLSANPQSRRFVVAAQAKTKADKRRRIKNSLTMAIAAGIFTTVALPAYAYSPDEAALAGFTTTNAAAYSDSPEYQGLTVAQVKAAGIYERSNYTTTSAAELARRILASKYISYSGPSAEQIVENPPYSKIDGATILAVAAKYVGTPYVFGGANPNGFDCSGYVRFVFAQFGMLLPHSVIAQSRMGIIVKPEDAMPGDIVVLNNLSHDGIYAGNGNFYHAPRRGDTVKLAKIFTDQVFYVRLGTN